jgi:hypothetical protein
LNIHHTWKAGLLSHPIKKSTISKKERNKKELNFHRSSFNNKRKIKKKIDSILLVVHNFQNFEKGRKKTEKISSRCSTFHRQTVSVCRKQHTSYKKEYKNKQIFFFFFLHI